MNILPLILFVVVFGTISWFAAKPKKHETRSILCFLLAVVMSALVGLIIYPLGGYTNRVKAYQGNHQIKKFLEQVDQDLSAGNEDLARRRIDILLSQWDDIEFLEKEDGYGIYIGDVVEEAIFTESQPEPVGAGQPDNPPVKL